VDPNIREITQRVADDAGADAPRLTGRLAGSYRVEHGRELAVYLVTTDVEYARFVEYGTRNMPAQAPLGRALAAARRG
jgi:hypothetical protein